MQSFVGILKHENDKIYQTKAEKADELDPLL
jgi:hypothetical protein